MHCSPPEGGFSSKLSKYFPSKTTKIPTDATRAKTSMVHEDVDVSFLWRQGHLSVACVTASSAFGVNSTRVLIRMKFSCWCDATSCYSLMLLRTVRVKPRWWWLLVIWRRRRP